jgi:tetratricopeptide (TPR) repeat protein
VRARGPRVGEGRISRLIQYLSLGSDQGGDPVAAFTVFLSVGTELKVLRDALHDVLSKAGVHCLTQDHSLGQAPLDVRENLATDVAQSEVVLHIAGDHYGANAADSGRVPFPQQPDFECSWTQFEYYHAHALQKHVYGFVMAPSAVPETARAGWSPADLTRRQTLQQAHRVRVIRGSLVDTPGAGAARTSNHPDFVVDDLDMLRQLVGVVRRGEQDWGGCKDKIARELFELRAQWQEVREAVQRIEEQSKSNFASLQTKADGAAAQLDRIEAAVTALVAERAGSAAAATNAADARSPEALRSALEDIIQTREGQHALLRFQQGDEVSALRSLDQLRAAQARSVANLALTARDRGKLSTADVIKRYTELTRLDPDAFWDHIELSRLLQSAGKLPRAKVIATVAEKLALRRVAECGEDHAAQRDLTVSLANVGGIKAAQGDAAGALNAYQRMLQITEALSAADLSSAEAKRDVSISLDNVGRIKAAQGDAAGALDAYLRSLQISESLSAADPSSAQAKRDVSISLNNVGGIKAAQGDAAGAFDAYLRSLQIREALSAADRSSAQAKRDVSVSLDNVGRIKAAQGDAAGALDAYLRSLQIREALSAADLSNATALRDLAISHANLWQLATEREVEIRHARVFDRIFSGLESRGAHIRLEDRAGWLHIQHWLKEHDS